MEISLVLGLLKVALEVFQNETKDKYLKRYNKIKREYDDEIAKGIDDWSDRKLNELLIEAAELSELVIRERQSK